MKVSQFFAIVSLTLLWSCGAEEKPAVVYPTDVTETVTEPPLIVDTTLVLTGELPIHFDSTDYLLFPTGPVKVSSRDGRKVYLGAVSTGDVTFALGYLNGPIFNGDLDNIMIQELGSSDFRPLTNQTLKIRSFQFLTSIRKLTGLQLLVMKVTDRDTNRNGRLTDDDIASLYISDLKGDTFKKLTPEFHELLNWKILKVNQRLYFRTLEDSDKNGLFNKEDKIHHFYVSLDDSQLTVVEYNPLG